jgi:hypothetical protein
MKRPTPKQNLMSSVLLVTIDLLLGSVLWIANYVYSIARGRAEIILRPLPIYWYVDVIFVAVMLGSMFYVRAARRLTVRQRHINVWFMCLFAILPLMHGRKHARFSDSALIDQRMFALGEDTYPYSAVTDIMLARYWISSARGYNGPSPERSIFIKFNDGMQWSAKDSELHAGEVLSTEIARLISDRTRLPVQYLRPDIVIGQPRIGRRRE